MRHLTAGTAPSGFLLAAPCTLSTLPPSLLPMPLPSAPPIAPRLCMRPFFRREARHTVDCIPAPSFACFNIQLCRLGPQTAVDPVAREVFALDLLVFQVCGSPLCCAVLLSGHIRHHRQRHDSLVRIPVHLHNFVYKSRLDGISMVMYFERLAHPTTVTAQLSPCTYQNLQMAPRLFHAKKTMWPHTLCIQIYLAQFFLSVL